MFLKTLIWVWGIWSMSCEFWGSSFIRLSMQHASIVLRLGKREDPRKLELLRNSWHPFTLPLMWYNKIRPSINSWLFGWVRQLRSVEGQTFAWQRWDQYVIPSGSWGFNWRLGIGMMLNWFLTSKRQHIMQHELCYTHHSRVYGQQSFCLLNPPTTPALYFPLIVSSSSTNFFTWPCNFSSNLGNMAVMNDNHRSLWNVLMMKNDS